MVSEIVKWFAGSDHAGIELKNALIEHLRALGDEVEDLGTDSSASVDYPDYGRAVAERVAADPRAVGLLVCGTGNGIAIAANKVPGVRAAVVGSVFTARMARAHNNANAIAFGQRVTGVGVALEAVQAFRDARFEGGRHQRRVDKIMAIETDGGAPAGAPARSDQGGAGTDRG